MDFIDVKDHDQLASYLEGPLNFASTIQHYWDSDVFEAHSRMVYCGKDYEDPHIKNNICFRVGDDYIELSNSVFEEEPEVDFLPDLGGEARTLGLSCKFKMENILIAGNICILNVSNSLITSDYELRLKDVDLTTIFGFFIGDDSFYDDDIKHEFQKANVSLTYKNGSQVISIFDKVTDSRTKHLLESYIVHKCTDEILKTIQNIFLYYLGFSNGYAVSATLGGGYPLRNAFRLHEMPLKAAFIILADKILEMTNQTIKQKTPNISLPKLFEMFTNNGDTKSIKIYKGSMNIANTLKRVKTPIILLENDLVTLYISVDLSKIQVTYEKGEKTNQEFFRTIDSYLKLSIKKLDTGKAEINLLNFKIKEFKSLSKSHLILDYLESSLVEEKIKEYFTETLKTESINTFAVHPPNVEIQYDRDDEFLNRDSEEDGM